MLRKMRYTFPKLTTWRVKQEHTPSLYDTLVQVLRQHRKWLDVRHL